MRKRADIVLVERGLFSSRARAQAAIAAGLVSIGGAALRKASEEVAEDASIEAEAPHPWASRGGVKLAAALDAFALDPSGLVCLDVGASTGGFTDCLLQRGAAHVIGVDVGHGQLHPRLRGDARVTAIEGVNARTLSADAWAALSPADTGFDLIVGDLSFISLTLVLPALVPLLKASGDLLMLVKPQFELQPGQVGKGGIVRDPALYTAVEQRLRDACTAVGLRVARWLDSPIAGGDGNREFFIHAVRANGEPGAGRAPSAQL